MKLLHQFCFSFLILITACTTSNLHPIGVKPEITALAESNNRILILNVTNSFNQECLGHQYMGILFPIGQIRHEYLEQALTQKLYTELALRGYQPKLNLSKPEQDPKWIKLSVELERIQLTAYDLLVTRKVVSKVRLRGEIRAREINTPLIYTVDKADSEFKTMPFDVQLQRILDKSMESTINELLTKLRL